MSRFRKARHRLRLRQVDKNIDVVAQGLKVTGYQPVHKLAQLEIEVPKESEMPAKDKYWVFSRTSRGYRKGAHRQPKWTKITNRVPPTGF